MLLVVPASIIAKAAFSSTPKPIESDKTQSKNSGKRKVDNEERNEGLRVGRKVSGDARRLLQPFANESASRPMSTLIASRGKSIAKSIGVGFPPVPLMQNLISNDSPRMCSTETSYL